MMEVIITLNAYDYRNICESGCRVDAKAYTGKINGRDPLMVGPIVDGEIKGQKLKFLNLFPCIMISLF